ncbi:MAG: DNRLRE domain-containing protein, partial [Pirellulales bacterium]|nr:DNRLRE domain-containing protein [Pirellulales bacterium]
EVVDDPNETIAFSFQDGVFPDTSYAGTRDSMIKSGRPDRNYGSTVTVEVDGSPQYSGFLRWDVSTIPPGSTVHKATIRLDLLAATNDTYELYALRRPWSENEVTFNRASGSMAWEVAGAQGPGDRGDTVLGAISRAPLGPAVVELDAAGIAVVQSWIDDPAANYGLIFQDYVSASDAFEFQSRESLTPNLRPRIDILVASAGQPSNAPPVVDAGANQTVLVSGVAVLDGTVSDDGLPDPPGAVTTRWTRVSGPGTVAFANAFSIDTTATFSTAGVYVLRLTADDGQSVGGDDVVVTVQSENTPDNRAPVVDAGAAQQILATQAAALDGTVTDDGLPAVPGNVVIAWSKASGPGVVSFALPADADTTATFSSPGIYVLRLEAFDGERTGSDEVTVTVAAVNQAPLADAGPDQTVSVSSPATLDGTVSDDGLPTSPGRITASWTKRSGPGTVTFGNASAVDTTATFSAPGVYVLQLSADDGELSTADQTTITVQSVNTAPSVNAGPDQTITISGPAHLDGTVADDGLPNPPGSFTAAWSKLSGPGVVTFGNASAVDTTATFNLPGAYILRLTAFDGQFTISDDVAITVQPVNQAPVANAGPDQSVARSAALVLDGTVTDDGLPNPPAAVSTTWTKVSGPGTVAFGNASFIDTTATFSAPGIYTVRLTANDGALAQSDEATITVTDPSAAVTVSFQNGAFPSTSYTGTRDTKIRSNYPTTVYGSNNKLELDGKPDFSSLIRWDLSSIPADATITSAAITVYVVEPSLASFELYELKRAWNETETTFQRATSAQAWQVAGASGAADRGSTVLGAVSARAIGLQTFTLNAAGVSVIQAWLASPALNHGFILQDYADASTDDLDFRSREAKVIQERPRLSITYVPGSTQAAAMTRAAAGDTAVRLLFAAEGSQSNSGGTGDPASGTSNASIPGPAHSTLARPTVIGGRFATTAGFRSRSDHSVRRAARDAAVSALSQSSDTHESLFQRKTEISGDLLAELVNARAGSSRRL